MTITTKNLVYAVLKGKIGLIGTMLFKDENVILYHPGKCGGTTIEHLFLRILKNTNLATILKQPCFSTKNNKPLTADCLSRRINFMLGYITKDCEVDGISQIFLQHADIQASIKIHGRDYIDSLFKVTFIRNPFPRILSAFYYNMWDRKTTFRDFVLHILTSKYQFNQNYTVNHFGELNRFTHYDGQQYVNFIGKLENINADVEKLSKQLSLPLYPSFERKHAKTVSSNIYEHYSEAYDDEMVDFVYNLYQKDFDLFDYTFKRELPFNPDEYK
ncbi:MAG: sulfotransferase family 2 domain-containing protein [Anaerolineae bacterium]|nr:sulfotransferase family 2 domain-containing protein [Anaerolineae bacterium]